ncbi:hypothetical protein OFO01_00845 [Campylobacter sp. JMF_01 NE2]|uniref:hypothetical protein n=1 Tax=unclassified Campylobacter TaxID=2593542 RepID=UPI0022E9B723|nr:MULTISPECIES: hypothetical protein [unclassified Campylobacter]MDA3052003.1 hypothetical protein [Campylobacter sp. JMF_03 NE3]MDA3066337.1 hypothetical protein [Campylobacter sp. JMF_01 NE2]
MKILIAEKESYLANSLSLKLSALNHQCTVVSTLPLALNAGEFDAVLLSSSWGSGDLLSVIARHKNAIVIMLVSYISNDTVTAPINAGATDYILKPFMIEDLIKKLDHYAYFKQILHEKERNDELLRALKEIYDTPKISAQKLKFPLFLKGYDEISRLLYAHQIAQNFGVKIIIANGEDCENLKIKNEILFVQKFDKTSPAKRAQILSNFAEKRLVLEVCSMEFSENSNQILLSPYCAKNKILSLEEYLKFAILAHQGEYFDSELASILGISRKSLWEKRKKYGITRKK